MTARRNIVPVFTSSTFRDMALERDALVKNIFPSLSDTCRGNGIFLEPIDLRWGQSEETEHPKILEIVKSELNRAAVMISVLGERFGWIPEGEYDSVTVLEIYTALASPAIRLLVFNREPSLTIRLAGGQNSSDFLTAPELEQTKLIRRLEHLGVTITPYSSIDDFTEEVTTQIRKVLEEAYFTKIGNVFISYSRNDIEKGERLRKLLEGIGFNVWLDLIGIAAGEEWPTKLAQAISDSDVVLMLISEASVASEYCLKEIIFAKKKNKPIVGLRLDGSTLPDRIEFMLGDVQQLELTNDGRLDTVVSRLSDGLRTQIERSRQAQQTYADQSLTDRESQDEP